MEENITEKKNKIIKIVDWTLLFFTFLIFLFSIIFHEDYYKTFLGIYLLIINGYLCIKWRNSKRMFFLFIILFYFNFSVAISRYIGNASSVMKDVYTQIENQDTMIIGILLQILFLQIINLIVGNKEGKLDIQNKENKDIIEFKYRKVLVLLLQICLILILSYHVIFNITQATTILEYSIFLFIFALYFSKNDKKNRIITEILILLFAIYSLKNGDRIAILQIILADFIINYIEKIKIKYILIIMIIGILIFTCLGLYGDFLIYGYDFKNLTIQYAIDEVKERRFALDTSVSAYFTGVSMIDVRNNYTVASRINDGIDFFTKYTFLGNKSGYVHIPTKIREYQLNYAGGFLTCYFYYWFSWIGVIFISCYVGLLIKKVIVNSDNLYKQLLSILLVATVPRWYLYDPILLFRGIILFSIFYYIISKLFLENKLDKIILKLGKKGK